MPVCGDVCGKVNNLITIRGVSGTELSTFVGSWLTQFRVQQVTPVITTIGYTKTPQVVNIFGIPVVTINLSAK